MRQEANEAQGGLCLSKRNIPCSEIQTRCGESSGKLAGIVDWCGGLGYFVVREGVGLRLLAMAYTVEGCQNLAVESI
ncbi:hypothetical protein CEXT_302581 [Caerostris extrusa]|uniref:Uncharacterized protein n=1 Tax=Caerostris extrusa TaxID=172846 RepID=A0AAV4VEY5_CAEEX|nr:hypothetical protein CEXT_302581 [Caerostris extrusa]